MRIQRRCRASAEKNRRRGVDEGEEEVAGDFAEVHARDKLLERLEVGVDRLAIELVVEWCAGKCRALWITHR